MDNESLILKLTKNLYLLRKYDFEDEVFLEVTDKDSCAEVMTDSSFFYRIDKNKGTYEELSSLSFMLYYVTEEKFPEFFVEENIKLDDVITRINESKTIKSKDIFDLRKIYFPDESVHISYFNNTYDSFLIVTEREDVADRFFKTFEYIGVSCKKMLDPRFLEVMVDLEFKLMQQNDLLIFEKTIIGLDSFLDKIKEENYVKFEFVNNLVHLNFKEEILEKKQVLSDSVPYVIESNNSKVIDFLVNILDTVSVKYNRMLYNKNLEINPLLPPHLDI